MGDKVDLSRGLRGLRPPEGDPPRGSPEGGLEPRARGEVDLIALVLGSELLYYNPPHNVFMTLSPTVKSLGPEDNGNFLSLCLTLKFEFLYNNGRFIQ